MNRPPMTPTNDPKDTPMTNEPDYAWALPIAVERLNAEYKAKYGRGTGWGEDSPPVILVAELIAKYEQPPADPVEEAAARVLNAWHGSKRSAKWWAGSTSGPFPLAVKVVREILAEQVKP